MVNLSTVGIVHGFHTFQLSDGTLVNVDIVDTAGQENFRALSSQYYKKADGCLLVYEITNRKTFESIKDYYFEQIQENCKKDIKVIVLGNKTDLEYNREVNPEEGANFAAENGYIFLETSCLKNQTVADSFETLIELIYREAEEKNLSNLSKETIDIKKTSKSKKKKIC